MDPVTMVAAAVAAGAAAGASETTKQAVSDAYRALKDLLARRYRSVDIDAVESDPESVERRETLSEELLTAGAAADEEVLAAAHDVLVVVYRHARPVAETVGVHLRRIDAEHLEIRDIVSTGTGVIAEDASLTGTITITGVRAGGEDTTHPPTARP